MGRHPRRKKSADILDLVPPIGGLIALCCFFVPGFRQLLSGTAVLLLGLAIVAAVALIGWKIWRRRTIEGNPEPALPAWEAPAIKTQELILKPRQSKPEWTAELLSALEWKRFEDLVAAYSRELGYEAKTTRIGADGGVDVQLFQDGQPQPVMIIQCKAWDAYKVGVKPVRELFGVMAADKVANGAFFTTGEFTAEAEEWSREKNLDLVNGREFLSRMGQLPSASQDKLLALATDGDYTTPTCPSCGIKMVTRTATKGSSEGENFWGCRNYPQCRRTFRFST